MQETVSALQHLFPLQTGSPKFSHLGLLYFFSGSVWKKNYLIRTEKIDETKFLLISNGINKQLNIIIKSTIIIVKNNFV